MSLDIRIAIVRFPGQFFSRTRTQISVPPGFLKTPTLTRQNPYPPNGYRFSWVRVRVALEYPRVTHDNH